MAIKINSRSNRSNCSLSAIIPNSEGTGINVNITWDYDKTAPTSMYVNASYSDPNGGFSASINRQYTSSEAYTPSADVPCPKFDSTFDASLSTLVGKCFDNYNNIYNITE